MKQVYDLAYQLTHDIDWFCMIGNVPMHFASNGGILPNKVNNYERNRRIQMVVEKQNPMFEKEDILINNKYLLERFGSNDNLISIQRYLESFIEMARKGFMSFDRVKNENKRFSYGVLNRLNNREDSYIWIAKPKLSIDCSIKGLPKYAETVCLSYNSGKEIIHVNCLNGRLSY